MTKRLTKRFVVKNIEDLPLSSKIHYERYYLNDFLRIQKKEKEYIKETLNEENCILSKEKISEKEFLKLKRQAYKCLVRDSYLYLKDNRVSIKTYFEDYFGFNRVEVKFETIEEMNQYKKESWMGEEITNSPLAFDKYLSKLTKEEFLEELKKFLD